MPGRHAAEHVTLSRRDTLYEPPPYAIAAEYDYFAAMPIALAYFHAFIDDEAS